MYFRCPECKKTFPNKRARDGHIGGAHSRFKVDKVESVLEDLMKQKKQALMLKQMNDMMGDDLPKTVTPKWKNKIKVEDSSGNILGEWTTDSISVSVIGNSINIEFGRSK